MTPEMLQESVAVLREAYALGGWWALLIGLVVVCVNLYQVGGEAYLPEPYRFSRLALGWQLAVVALAGVASGFLAHGLGAGIAAAALAGVLAALAAVGTHLGVLKPAGAAMLPKVASPAMRAAASLVVHPGTGAVRLASQQHDAPK
jgi:hypothetical protein